LLETAKAGELLEKAAAQLKDGNDLDAANLHRVWGDWHARRGDAAAALAAYHRAAEKRALGLNVAQQNARRGACSRSAEAFLRDADLPRASEQLSQWQQDFPQDKPEGYLSTLLARYWMARSRPNVALAVAGDLLTVAPQSPYADRLMLVQAEAEEALGHPDRAIAACETLLADYPGSPLRDAAKEKIAAVKAAATQRPDRRKGAEDTPTTKKTQPAGGDDQLPNRLDEDNL
jgi:tetratricopeptide (TPR) repeat protein